mmetsp:Transcript_23356/g.59658  ORF Transcript_23356/g.59658 Transcript_23356/m.59658 type:complete len:202 (+) Transcript_23356:1656-2261(+)
MRTIMLLCCRRLFCSGSTSSELVDPGGGWKPSSCTVQHSFGVSRFCASSVLASYSVSASAALTCSWWMPRCRPNQPRKRLPWNVCRAFRAGKWTSANRRRSPRRNCSALPARNSSMWMMAEASTSKRWCCSGQLTTSMRVVPSDTTAYHSPSTASTVTSGLNRLTLIGTRSRATMRPRPREGPKDPQKAPRRLPESPLGCS